MDIKTKPPAPALHFDRGIDSISHGSQSAGLPLGGTLAPSEVAHTPELDRLLARPTLRDIARQALRREVADKRLLTPAGYARALEADMALLAQRQADSRDSASAAIYGAALDELRHHTDLRTLLGLYRGALLIV